MQISPEGDVFASNIALEDGGAVFVEDNYIKVTVTFENTTFRENSAVLNGGGVYH